VSRILVVDDHQNLVESLRRGLERVGNSVVTAATGEDGLRLALAQNIEIVILDLMLPGKSGFEVLAELRLRGFHQPVLILSAKDSPEDRERARECGANDFLIKPFAFTDLVSRLNDLLEQARQPGTTP